MGLSRGERLICLLALCFVLLTAGNRLLRDRAPAPLESLPPLHAPAPAATAPPGAWRDGRLLLNAADAAELDELPGIGPALAEEILALRRERGGFSSLEELLDVPGIGPAKLEDMAPYLIVEED